MGNITVSDNVVSEIAYRAMCSFYGVEPEDRDFKKYKKNISIERTPEDNIIINSKIEVPYGENLVNFSQNLMKVIAENVTQMTEKVVEAVNLVITSITEPKNEEGTDSSNS
ncbi:MAG: Asp23/Gls24 family envelope stress response protein [Fervidobacterium sp.]